MRKTPYRGSGWLVLVLLCVFLVLLAIQAVRPMVSYRALELGADATQLGIIAASYALFSFAFATPLGRWIDRLGAARFVVLGAVVTVSSSLLLSLVGNMFGIILAYAALGLGQVAALIAIQTIVANWGKDSGRNARFGVLSMVASFSQMVGPALAGLLYGKMALVSQSVFLIAAAIGCVGLLASVILLVVGRSVSLSNTSELAEQDSLFKSMKVVLSQPSVPHAMIASLTVLTTIDLLIVYLPAYGEVNGIDPEIVGLLLGARALGSIASRALMIPLLRMLDRKHLLAIAVLLPGIVLLFFPLTLHSPTMIALLGIAGFGLGLGQPLSMAWVADCVPRQIRGTALGIRITGNRVAQLTVPVAAGALAGVSGFGLVFVSCGGALAISSWVVARAPES